MDCLYCNTILKGFSDTRIVVVQGHRCIACADIEACNARVAEQERIRMGFSAPLI
jgi:hypothetical protein